MPAPADQTDTTPSRSTRLLAAAVLLIAALAGLSIAQTRAPLAAIPATEPIPALRLNINTATPAELQLLPRIGPTLAARIVEDRETNGPFESIEALDRVKGIGPRTILTVRPYLTAE